MKDLGWNIEPVSNLAKFSEDWNRLNSVHGGFILLDHLFFSEAVSHLAENPLQLAICYQGEHVVCITIVEKVRFGISRTFQPSQSPLGAWIQNPTIPTQLLIKSLAKKLHWWPLGFSITQQDPKLECLNLTQSQECNTLPYIETGSLQSTENFDTFWESRGKNLRQNTNKAVNRLNKESGTLLLKVITDPDDIDEAIEQYGKLESSGWKSGTNTAITPDNDQGRFYKSLFRKLAHNKQTIIFQLFLGDTIIASDLTVLSNQSIIILKTTYDENYKRFSPATVLRKFQFEKIFNDPQISQIEFYGKMMDWHYRWTNDTREMFHLNWLSKTGKAIKSIREKIK
ncbi:GNAT family N-acetyltransferase [Neptunomonas phycophila]|uniref:GNAT family N-acetyltransferase n=1 Tax=Neptunomonas phycophila TaxID=1572645 RepID=A0AAW7XN52_9GAMM|nr:GNAT family N-acetyltransferase [Neptunomonas phycophila]MDO6454479.1 GNAT family N-acetyltransferase [Neptunomonas phycophila]